MTCQLTGPISCAVGSAAGAIAGAAGNAIAASTGNAFADAMRDGAAWVIKTTIGWWIEVPSLDLTTSPAAGIRASVWWLSLVVAAAGLIWQGLRMALTRRPDPLVDAGRGLVTYALWAAVGILGPNLALKAGDEFSSWVLDAAARGQVSDRLIKLASLNGIDNAGAAIVLGLLVMAAGLVQAVLMMFREGTVVMLAGVVVLAAAGSTSPYGRPWLGKVLGWMLALIAYKPIAALVYAAALVMTGTATDPRSLLVGITMLILSVVALPALMRFFTWATGQAQGFGGAGAVAGGLGLAASGLQAASALRGGGSSGAASGGGGDSAAQSAALRSDLGPPMGSPGGGGGGSGTPPTGAAPTGAAPAGVAPSPVPPAAASAGAAPASAGAAGGAAAGAGAATGGVATAVIAAAGTATRVARSAADQAGETLTEGAPS